MAEWSKNKVDSDQLNGGQEYTVNDNVSREQLNSMVNAGLYAQDFVGKMVENIDTSDVANVGTPSVEIVDGDGATSDKPYKKFKFANLKGEQGIQGETGNGISNISKTGTSELIDTYKITFTNGNTTTFTVTNGKSITNIAKTATSGLNDTYTISYNDNTTSEFIVTNGAKGDQGIQGEKGDTGETPIISVEAVTLPAGSSATATTSGSPETPVITFGIPKGEQGDAGEIYQTTGTSTTGGMSQKAITEQCVLQGGTLTAPLTVTGGDGATAGKIMLIGNGQITDEGTNTLFGRSGDTTLYCGHSNFGLRLRGSETTPKYNGTALIDLFYPVDSIYLSVGSTSPASFLGGTWKQIEDRFLLGAGSTYSNGSTGGEATHTLTVAEMPSHTHSVKTLSSGYSANCTNFSSGAARAFGGLENSGDIVSVTNADRSGVQLIDNTGGGSSHNNMPPYLVVYMWKRIQ